MASEQDLILIHSELKLIVYGIPGSEVYPGLQHESCGVDSYSLSDRAIECMAICGYEPTTNIEHLADDLAKDITFFCELTRWLEDLNDGTPAHEVVRQIKESYFVED